MNGGSAARMVRVDQAGNTARPGSMPPTGRARQQRPPMRGDLPEWRGQEDDHLARFDALMAEPRRPPHSVAAVLGGGGLCPGRGHRADRAGSGDGLHRGGGGGNDRHYLAQLDELAAAETIPNWPPWSRNSVPTSGSTAMPRWRPGRNGAGLSAAVRRSGCARRLAIPPVGAIRELRIYLGHKLAIRHRANRSGSYPVQQDGARWSRSQRRAVRQGVRDVPGQPDYAAGSPPPSRGPGGSHAAQDRDHRVNQLIVYGDDQRPPSTGDEITVCARKAESERYSSPRICAAAAIRLGNKRPGPNACWPMKRCSTAPPCSPAGAAANTAALRSCWPPRGRVYESGTGRPSELISKAR